MVSPFQRTILDLGRRIKNQMDVSVRRLLFRGTRMKKTFMRTRAITRNLEVSAIPCPSQAQSSTRVKSWLLATLWTDLPCHLENKRTRQPEVIKKASARLPSWKLGTRSSTTYPRVQVSLTKVKFCSWPLSSSSQKARTRRQRTCTRTKENKLGSKPSAQGWFKTLRYWTKAASLRNRFAWTPKIWGHLQQQPQQQQWDPKITSLRPWDHRRSLCSNASTTRVGSKSNELRTTIFECLICASIT
jgi:hypothetical protein